MGSEISINAVPSSSPINTYSSPFKGSVHPQLSLAPEVANTPRGIWETKSYPSHGYAPAIPATHGVCANNPLEINKVVRNSNFFIRTFFSLIKGSI